jgi:hypothetical protein
MPSQIEQWKMELGEITNDVTDLMENQHIFHRVGEIILANIKINSDNFFWDHLRANYGAAMVVGIGRQVDERRDVISLMRLLKSIEKNNKIITKKWFADQYGTGLIRQVGEQHFADHFGKIETLDASVIKNDIAGLTAITENVKKFRHTRIAHKNKDRSLQIDLSFREIDDAVAFLEKLVIKYQLLLNQKGFTTLMPTVVYDWEAVLRTPWIE